MGIKIYGHPRSGNNWYENRVRLFYYKCLGQKPRTKELHNKIDWGHMNFQSEVFDIDPPIEQPKIRSGDHVTILLRDARAVLNSQYHHIKYTVLEHHKRNGLYGDAQRGAAATRINKLDNFVRGPFGVQRYCSYLNQLGKLVKGWPVKPLFLHYEEMFDREAIYNIPKSLGLDYHLSDEEVDYIHYNSNFKILKEGKADPVMVREYKDLSNRLCGISTDGKHGVFRKGKINSYKESLSEDLISYIDRYLKKKCTYGRYRKYYIEG